MHSQLMNEVDIRTLRFGCITKVVIFANGKYLLSLVLLKEKTAIHYEIVIRCMLEIANRLMCFKRL